MPTFIGKLVTQMREEKSLSIEELAQNSGITPEKLIDIESGKTMPSIGVMIKISRSLGARLGTLLDGKESRAAVVTRSSATPSNSTTASTNAHTEGLDFFPLAQGKLDRHMEPFIIEIPVGSQHNSSQSEHEGEEFLYVLEGCVDISYGAEQYRLERGDSIYYDSIVPHTITNHSMTQAAKALAVVYTPM